MVPKSGQMATPMDARVRLLCVLPVVLLLLSGFPQCTAVDHAVTWAIPPTPTLLEVACNDTISLTWAGTHDVTKAATGDCPANGVQLVPVTTGSTYTYRVAETNGTFWLNCGVGSHCASGQNLKVNVTSCPTAVVNTTATTNSTNGTTNSTVTIYDAVFPKANGFNTYYNLWRPRKMKDLQLVCGDDVLFSWKSVLGHSLLLKPYAYGTGINLNDTCLDMELDTSHKLLVPSISAANYTFTPTENGDYYFVCTVGQHCLNGQRIVVSVTGCKTTSTIYKPAAIKVEGTPSPSSTPSPAPKGSSSSPPSSLALGAAALAVLSMLWSMTA